MYFFYIDESGDKNPLASRSKPYVLTAVGFHESRWKSFETTINTCKRKLIQNIHKRKGGNPLELADAEIHSNEIRNALKRSEHHFLGALTPSELTDITNLFYDSMGPAKIVLFSVVVDKDKLKPFMDIEKLHKKAYELLLERVENFLYKKHNNEKAIFIHDNTQKQLNKSIAMKHIYFQQNGTSSGLKLNHILELPFFVESYLSNGVQLADLCAYNIYRAFLDNNPEYPYFERILPFFDGINLSTIKRLKLFPDNHKWSDLLARIQNKKALSTIERA